QDLSIFRGSILLAAERNDKQFFIWLGKCLSGEITAKIFDNTDLAIADLIYRNPSIKAKEAVCELKQRGLPQISEDNFRMRKKRLGLSNPARKPMAFRDRRLNKA